MNYLDYFQVITLITFLLVFFGRTIWLKQEGTKVFVLGSGKKGLTALLEKSFLIFFPIWLIEIFIHSLHLNIQFLPLLLAKQILIQKNGDLMLYLILNALIVVIKLNSSKMKLLELVLNEKK